MSILGKFSQDHDLTPQCAQINAQYDKPSAEQEAAGYRFLIEPGGKDDSNEWNHDHDISCPGRPPISSEEDMQKEDND